MSDSIDTKDDTVSTGDLPRCEQCGKQFLTGGKLCRVCTPTALSTKDTKTCADGMENCEYDCKDITALSSIDFEELLTELVQNVHQKHPATLDLIYIREASKTLEAHIAEHYVPKAEVRDDLEYTLAHFIPKARLQEALTLVQALIQDAVDKAEQIAYLKGRIDERNDPTDARDYRKELKELENAYRRTN